MALDCTLLLTDALSAAELRAHLVSAGGVPGKDSVWLSEDRSAATLAEPWELDEEMRADMKVFRINAKSMVMFYLPRQVRGIDQVVHAVEHLAKVVPGDFVLVFIDTEIMRRKNGEVTVRKPWRDDFGHLATHHAVAAK